MTTIERQYTNLYFVALRSVYNVEAPALTHAEHDRLTELEALIPATRIEKLQERVRDLGPEA